MMQQLDDLMRRCREEDHAPTYRDLVELRAAAEDAQGEIRALRATEAGLRERLAAIEKAIMDAEPVAWVNKGQIKSAEISRERGGPYDSHMWNECPTAFFQEPLYTLNWIKP